MSQGPVVGALDRLSAVLPGLVVRPGEPAWDAAARRLRLPVDASPAAVVAVEDEEDVVAAVDWASVQGADVGIRSTASVVLDLGGLRRLSVDADRRIARVGAGVTCERLLAAVGAFGLTWPAWGSRSATVAAIAREDPVAGHTVVGVDLVRPSGERRWVTASIDPGLFGALRSGEEGLGVVVGLDVALHPRGVPAPRPPALE